MFEPLTTNETLNTIDDTPPVGTMNPVPATSPTEDFEISWTGTDEVGEVTFYAVYVSRDGGPFRQLIRSREPASVTFEGETGSVYGFLCIAGDSAGNMEALDDVAEVVVTVEETASPLFHRGDPNSSGSTDISDGIAIFNYLFLGGPPATLSCVETADTNNDAAVDLADGIYLLNWLFLGGTELPSPGAADGPCGPDTDAPGTAGDLGCEEYGPCA